MAAPERALHQVSKSLPFEEAVWIEPLSCVVNCTDVAAIQPGQTAVVIGAGPIGILQGMMFKSAGAKVIIADIAPYRLADMVQAETGGWGAELIGGTVGNQFGVALELAAKEGKIALFGVNEKALPPVQQYQITRNELTVFGSFVGENTFPRAIQILESGAIKPSVMNSMILPLPDIFQGIDAARQGEAVKVVVTAN